MLLTALVSAITLDQYFLGLGGIFTARQLKNISMSVSLANPHKNL